MYTEDKKFIKLLQEGYNNQISKIPLLDDIIFVNTSEYNAQVMSDDLYHQKYILYINKTIMDFCFEAIQPIIFHELTHISDSLSFLEYSYDDFKDIMNSYSEFHASQIEMQTMLSSIKKVPTLADSIIHNIGSLTIESFMSQSFTHVQRDFDLMSKNKENNIFFDLNNFYYHLGYIKALNKAGIKYSFPFYEIDLNFMLECDKLSQCLLNDDIDYVKILELHKQLIEKTKKVKCLNDLEITIKKNKNM